jgi:hypothetical protein
MITSAEFKITEWKTVEVYKEKKLSKKKREICKFFGIPIPPRRIFMDVEIKTDAQEGLLCVNDVIHIPGDMECQFCIMRPPKDGVYFMSSLTSIWYPITYIGPSIVLFHALGER